MGRHAVQPRREAPMDNTIRVAGTSRRRLLLGSAAVRLGALAAPAGAQTPGCPEDTLDRIQRSGTFNLGVRDSAPPYGFKDAGGQYTGFATEMARAIYDAVNKEL